MIEHEKLQKQAIDPARSFDLPSSHEFPMLE